MSLQPIDNSPITPAGSFLAQLQPASYRGIPFSVLSGQSRFGRRAALHEYPFRDTPYSEDLGRQSRRLQVTGFLVGDDVIAQRDRLIAACESPGNGELMHPTLGRLKVALTELSTAEHWEQGRVFEINFTFVEQGDRQFPGPVAGSTAAITAATNTTRGAAAQRWNAALSAQIAQGASIAPLVSALATTWSNGGIRAVNSATSLMNIATSLQGSYGRLLGQASGIAIDAIADAAGVASLDDLIGAAAAKRSAAGIAASTLSAAAAGLSAAGLDAFVALAATFAATVRVASFTPADALRSASAMTIIGRAAEPVGLATADLFRRLAVCELANASGAYQPSTAEEAVAVRSQVLGSIDAEITTAGDQGDDAVYAAMRALRAETIRDMNAKGASLPTLITVTTPGPVPSLVLAQRLYQDIGREPELVRRAGVIHPAFMPLSLKALSE